MKRISTRRHVDVRHIRFVRRATRSHEGGLTTARPRATFVLFPDAVGRKKRTKKPKRRPKIELSVRTESRGNGSGRKQKDRARAEPNPFRPPTRVLADFRRRPLDVKTLRTFRVHVTQRLYISETGGGGGGDATRLFRRNKPRNK